MNCPVSFQSFTNSKLDLYPVVNELIKRRTVLILCRVALLRLYYLLLKVYFVIDATFNKNTTYNKIRFIINDTLL